MTKTSKLIGAAVMLVTGACYADAPNTRQTLPEPTVVEGPPSGPIDPYNNAPAPGDQPNPYDGQAPDQANIPPAYGDNNQPAEAPPPDGDQTAPTDPYAQGDTAPAVDPNSATGNVDDQEIDQTLAPYGQWIDIPGYGRVWRPDPTVVGEDFTPYESAGTWVDSDAGWTFACDWDWGWLPFHYGRWDWFDGGYWGWVPGYTWGPGWVEWRHGGGMVGWRPLRPVRDHGGVIDHRSNWRFTRDSDFGHGHIRGHLASTAEGLRVTSPVGRLPLQGTRVATASVMHGRFTTSPRFNASRAGTFNRGGSTVRGSVRNPSYGAGQHQVYRGNERSTWQNNPRPQAYRQPAYQGYRQPAYRQPATTWHQQGSYRPSTPTYRPPARTYNGSSGGSFRSSGSTFHSSGSTSHSSGSSHSSSSHSSGGGGGHSGGGGGHHR